MAEVFAEFGAVVGRNGRLFIPRVCGAPMDNVWQGWIEFTAVDDGEIVRTPRETTQPNRTDLAYWTNGLTATYLEGALARALTPRPMVRESAQAPAAFDEPAPTMRTTSAPPSTPPESVLDPFSVYKKGERVLRRQLEALASWHLVNIIQMYGLSGADQATLDTMPASVLVDLIVAAVRVQPDAPSHR